MYERAALFRYQPAQSQCCHVRRADPGRLKLGPEGHSSLRVQPSSVRSNRTSWSEHPDQCQSEKAHFSERQKGFPRQRHNRSSASFHPPTRHSVSASDARLTHLGADTAVGSRPSDGRTRSARSVTGCGPGSKPAPFSKFSVAGLNQELLSRQANHRSGQIVGPVPVPRWSLAVPSANFGRGAPSRPTALRFPGRCAASRSRHSSSMRARIAA